MSVHKLKQALPYNMHLERIVINNESKSNFKLRLSI